MQAAFSGAAALKLFLPDAPTELAENTGSVLSPRTTLSVFFRRAFLPLYIEAQGLDAKTRVDYDRTVRLWGEITGDPALENIDDYLLADFAAALRELPGRSADKLSIGTQRKHLRNVQKLLRFAGPRGTSRTDRRNQRLLPEIPLTPDVRADEDPPNGDFTLAEVKRILAASASAAVPVYPGVAAGDWWRALVLTAAYTGLRIGALRALRWGWLHTLDDGGRIVNVPARVSKRRKGHAQYVRGEVVAAWERIRTTRDVVFYWPHCNRHLWQVHKRILRAAELPQQRQFGFQGYRKFHASQLAELCGDAGVRVAQQSLGHANPATTVGHYINGQVGQRQRQAAIESLPSFDQ